MKLKDRLLAPSPQWREERRQMAQQHAERRQMQQRLGLERRSGIERRVTFQPNFNLERRRGERRAAPPRRCAIVDRRHIRRAGA